MKKAEMDCRNGRKDIRVNAAAIQDVEDDDRDVVLEEVLPHRSLQPAPAGTAEDPIVLGLDTPPVMSLNRRPRRRRAEVAFGIEPSSPTDKTNAEAAKRLHSFTDALAEELTCHVCMEILFKSTSVFPCNHKYCAGCISEWMRKSRSCPICRKTIGSTARDHVLDKLVESLLTENPDRRRSAVDLAELDRKDTVSCAMFVD